MPDEKEEPPGPEPRSLLDAARDHAEDFAAATGEMVEKGARAAKEITEEVAEFSARATKDLTWAAVDTSVRELTRFGRMVLRAWKFGERMSMPPWTPHKVLAWVGFFLFVAIVTVLAYQIRYGLLTLPMVESAGLQFVTWLAALGAPGLFGFTAIGTLFFMIIPTEPFFFIVLAGDTSVLSSILAAAAGSTIGACVNYWIGNRIRVSAGKKRPGEERKLGRWGKRAHSKSGTLILFLAAALPVPELFAVAYGIVDYPFQKFLVVASIGRLVKWTWIAAAFLAFGFTL